MLLKPVSNPKQQIWTPTPIIQLVPLTAYYIFVLAAPRVAGTGAFLAIVILIRLLLVVPLTLPSIVAQGNGQSYLTLRKAHWVYACPFDFIAVCSALLWTFQTFVALYDTGFGPTRIVGALNDNPAVSALGYDFLFSMISIAIWVLLGGRDSA